MVDKEAGIYVKIEILTNLELMSESDAGKHIGQTLQTKGIKYTCRNENRKKYVRFSIEKGKTFKNKRARKYVYWPRNTKNKFYGNTRRMVNYLRTN